MTGGNWYAVLGPKNLPAPVVATLHTALAKTIPAPDSTQALAVMGVEPMVSADPKALQSFIQREFARWEPVVKAANIQSE